MPWANATPPTVKSDFDQILSLIEYIKNKRDIYFLLNIIALYFLTYEEIFQKLSKLKTLIFIFDNFMKEDKSLHVKIFYLTVAHTKMITDDY